MRRASPTVSSATGTSSGSCGTSPGTGNKTSASRTPATAAIVRRGILNGKHSTLMQLGREGTPDIVQRHARQSGSGAQPAILIAEPARVKRLAQPVDSQQPRSLVSLASGQPFGRW